MQFPHELPDKSGTVPCGGAIAFDEIAQETLNPGDERFGAFLALLLAQVRAKSSIPVAAGERVYTLYGFTDFLDQRAADVIQPDIFHTGGLYESKKIAAMAEARHIPVSFHNPSGPISNAAILQLAATVPNFLIHEIMLTDGSFRKRITNERVTFEDGYILIPEVIGLGIEVNEDVLAEYPY